MGYQGWCIGQGYLIGWVWYLIQGVSIIGVVGWGISRLTRGMCPVWVWGISVKMASYIYGFSVYIGLGVPISAYGGTKAVSTDTLIGEVYRHWIYVCQLTCQQAYGYANRFGMLSKSLITIGAHLTPQLVILLSIKHLLRFPT